MADVKPTQVDRDFADAIAKRGPEGLRGFRREELCELVAHHRRIPTSEAERAIVERCARVVEKIRELQGTELIENITRRSMLTSVAAAIRALPVGEGDPSNYAMALEGYRAAVQWVASDSWDGCSDCMQILKDAASADLDREPWKPEEFAAALKRLRARVHGPFAFPLTPSTDTSIPADVRRLVIAARIVWDAMSIDSPELSELDKALEAFSERVPYEDEPEAEAMPDTPARPDIKARVVRNAANSHLFDHQIVVDGDCVAFADDPWADRIAAGLGEVRLRMFLEILAAAGGQSDASDWPGSWTNAFCASHEGSEPDTFNIAIDRGLTRSTYDGDTDHGVVYITEAGRALLAKLSPADGGGE